MYVPARAVDKASPIPYYYQLQEILKEEIEAGTWGAGDFLPSEAELAHAHDISRTVIREALDVLESDGQIRRIKGKGTQVARPKYRYEALLAGADDGEGIVFGELIEARRTPAASTPASVLGLDTGADLLQLTFTQRVGSEVASLTQSFLPLHASAPLDALRAADHIDLELESGGPEVLSQLVEKYGISVVDTHLTIEGSVANEYEADVLGIKRRSAVFLLTSLDRSPAGQPVRFSRTIVRNDLVQFFMVIHRRGSERLSGEGMILAPKAMTLAAASGRPD